MTPALHKKGISGPSPRSGRLTIAQQFSAGRWTVTAPSPCNGRLLLSFGRSSAFSRPFHGLRSASANPSTQSAGLLSVVRSGGLFELLCAFPPYAFAVAAVVWRRESHQISIRFAAGPTKNNAKIGAYTT
jgi:hypothetical protein